MGFHSSIKRGNSLYTQRKIEREEKNEDSIIRFWLLSFLFIFCCTMTLFFLFRLFSIFIGYHFYLTYIHTHSFNPFICSTSGPCDLQVSQFVLFEYNCAPYKTERFFLDGVKLVFLGSFDIFFSQLYLFLLFFVAFVVVILFVFSYNFRFYSHYLFFHSIRLSFFLSINAF